MVVNFAEPANLRESGCAHRRIEFLSRGQRHRASPRWFLAFSFQRGDARPRIHSEVILVTEQIITQEAFMAGLSRTMDLQRADVAVAMGFKTRLIDFCTKPDYAQTLLARRNW